MSKRVVILGAGFGGLELSTVLSESGEDFDVTLIDKAAARVVARQLIAEARGETSSECRRAHG